MAIDLTTATYPFDPTGKAATNLITGEQQILTGANYRDYNFIVPKLAPFFANGLLVTFKSQSGETRTLTEGVDYYLTHWFIAASRACSTNIYGSISFLDMNLAGVVTLKYQTLGGPWTVDETQIAQILANVQNNPRVTAWDVVVNMPATFPPIDHEWDLVDMVGEKELVASLNSIADLLRQQGEGGLAAHLADYANPHKVTAAQVGLGNVQNYAVATDTQAIAGTSSTAYMTPLSTAKAVQAQAGTPLTAHKNDTSNPHNTTAAQVGTYSAGQIDTLMSTKLDRSAAATDTNKFNGLSPIEYRDFVLQSTAANSNKLGGLTLSQVQSTIVQTIQSQNLTGYTASQVDTLLATKLDKTAPASDTLLFGGKNPNDFTTAVLSGTAANAVKLNNMTVDQLTTYIAGKTNSFDPTQYYTTTQVDNFLSNKLSTTAAAADTKMFNGMLPVDFRSWVLTGVAADSARLSNMTVAELTTQILGGTAANATLWNGVSATDFQTAQDARYASINSTPERMRLAAYISTAQVAPVNTWTKLGQVVLPNPVGPFDGATDLQWLVTGGDPVGGTASGAFYVRAATRGPAGNQVSIKAVDMSMGSLTNVQFGYTVTVGANNSVAVIWMKTANNRAAIVTTRLSNGPDRLYSQADSGTPVDAEPTGIKYGTLDTYASKQALDSLTSAFNAYVAAHP